ncbi:hypothetical protein [Asanoa sp. NPDC050611]
MRAAAEGVGGAPTGVIAATVPGYEHDPAAATSAAARLGTVSFRND